MEAKTTKKQYNTVLSQAKKGVPGFTLAYGKFIEKTKGTMVTLFHFEANAPPALMKTLLNDKTPL